ncbi:hypothetical protein HKBW3S03_01540, partial [Candidatus Hakubella thermalkaliphila]
ESKLDGKLTQNLVFAVPPSFLSLAFRSFTNCASLHFKPLGEAGIRLEFPLDHIFCKLEKQLFIK